MALIDIARQVLKENTYMTLSTVSRDGAPWGTPVHFAHDGTYVYWLSKPETVHSHNLSENDRLFVTIFDAGQSVGESAQRRCVYLQTRGELLDGDEELAAREVYADVFSDEDGRDLAQWRYYRAEIGRIDEAKSNEQRVYFVGASA